jgi:cytochrome c heme-lyase
MQIFIFEKAGKISQNLQFCVYKYSSDVHQVYEGKVKPMLGSKVMWLWYPMFHISILDHRFSTFRPQFVLYFTKVVVYFDMTGCPMGYGSPENSSELNAKAAAVEVPKNSMMSSERETSSIPNREGKWRYPSPVQFYRNAVAKGHDVDPNDMNTVVSIHNAVNEETWRRIIKLESRYHAKECPSGPTLIRFVGKPQEPSLKAKAMHWLAGYVMPFDRHEWMIDRCGTGLFKYHVDFYDGPRDQSGKVNIYLDVRPAMDTMTGITDRIRMNVDEFLG